MVFIEPMHRNKPNITYLLDFTLLWNIVLMPSVLHVFIFVNSVIVSSIISCNDLYQDFIIMYV